MEELRRIEGKLVDLVNDLDELAARTESKKAYEDVMKVHRTVESALKSIQHWLDEPDRDEAYERAAARARSNDFSDTGGKDWT